MKLMKRAGYIILIPVIAAVIYFIVLPLHIHRRSVVFAQDIENLFNSRDMRRFDSYYEPDSVINIEGDKRLYSECRDNIIAYEPAGELPEGSYGHYSLEPFESPFGVKNMYFHGSAGEFPVYFHMKFGLFLKVDEIVFENDRDGFYRSFFFHEKTPLKDKEYFDDFQGALEIEEQLKSNPIDKTLEKRMPDLHETVAQQAELGGCYQAWLYDIEKTKELLIPFLSEGEEKEFVTYYEEWVKYRDSKFAWEQEQYYRDAGTISKIKVLENRADVAREFAFELKRHLYVYTGAMEFYDGGYCE